MDRQNGTAKHQIKACIKTQSRLSQQQFGQTDKGLMDKISSHFKGAVCKNNPMLMMVDMSKGGI